LGCWVNSGGEFYYLEMDMRWLVLAKESINDGKASALVLFKNIKN
jgi:hypothetical protein